MIVLDKRTFPMILGYMKINVNDQSLIRVGLTLSYTEVK